MRLIKIMRMDIIFLKLLVKKIIIKYSKVKCVIQKADMSIDFDIHELFYLKMNWVSIGKKVTNMAVISLK
jgi:hypothetical protein